MGPDVEETHLVSCDCKGVHIGPFPSHSCFQLLRCHVTNTAIFTGGRATM